MTYMEAIDRADELYPDWFYAWCEREGSIEELELRLEVKITELIS